MFAQTMETSNPKIYLKIVLIDSVCYYHEHIHLVHLMKIHFLYLEGRNQPQSTRNTNQ